MNVNKININQSEPTYDIVSNAYDITYEDTNVGEKLSELAPKINQTIFNIVRLEQGFINNLNGTLENSGNRIRTHYALYGSHTISAPEGLMIASVVYFTKDGKYSSFKTIDKKKANIGKDDCYALINLKKEDNSDISYSDYESINIDMIDSEIFRNVSKMALTGHVDMSINASEHINFPLAYGQEVVLYNPNLNDVTFYFESDKNDDKPCAVAMDKGSFAEISVNKNTNYITHLSKNMLNLRVYDKTMLQKKLVASAIMENGGILQESGENIDIKTRIRTDRIDGDTIICSPDGLIIYGCAYYSVEDDSFKSFEFVNKSVYKIGKVQCYARLVLASNESAMKEIDYHDYVNISSLSQLNERKVSVDSCADFARNSVNFGLDVHIKVGEYKPFPVSTNKIILQNTSAAIATFYLEKKVGDINPLKVGPIGVGSVYVIEPSDNYNFITHKATSERSFRCFNYKDLQKDLMLSTVFENGGISSSDGKNNNKVNTRIRTSRIDGSKTVVSPEGLTIYGCAYYSIEDGHFDSYVMVNYPIYNVGKEGCYARIVFSSVVSSSNIIDYHDYVTYKELSNLTQKQAEEQAEDHTCFAVYENGGIDYNGNFINTNTRIRTLNPIYGNVEITAPNGLNVYRVVYYNMNGKFDSIVVAETKSISIGKDNCYALITFCAESDSSKVIDYRSFVKFSVCSYLNEKIESVKSSISPKLAFYDYTDNDFVDVSVELSGMNFREQDGIECYTFQDQILRKFNGLMQKYPELVSKEDLAEKLGMEYPEYANLNGSARGEYLATPSYRTYLFKISSYDEKCNKVYTKKRKMLIVCGTHGWELASQFNAFIFASNLCKRTNVNYANMLAEFDVYIIPCLCGYGAYHWSRLNANGININRNFPTNNWVKQYEKGDYNYTGETAGSEFETQLVMNLTNLIKPDIAIDHHSYGYSDYNFYVIANTTDDIVRSYSTLNMFANKCNKEYPQYFGDKYKVFPESATFDIHVLEGSVERWFYENNVNRAFTFEVSLGISFLNGVQDYDTYLSTEMKEDAVKLNEFLTRHLLIRYAR